MQRPLNDRWLLHIDFINYTITVTVCCIFIIQLFMRIILFPCSPEVGNLWSMAAFHPGLKITLEEISLQEVKTKVGSCIMDSWVQICGSYMCLLSSEKRADVTEKEAIISPPTGITICSSQEHRQRTIWRRQKKGRIKEEWQWKWRKLL